MVETQQLHEITLLGRVLLTCQVRVLTGLHIGGGSSEMAIGGVDNIVVRDPLTQQPYLPGSSLKGKMRSLAEKLRGLRQNRPIGNSRIHSCSSKESTNNPQPVAVACDVCQVFGLPGEEDISMPTRLLVRDAFLTQESVQALGRLRTELPFTEVKWEAAIDRITSVATPRQMERVPAGVVFGPVELVYSCYQPQDVERFHLVPVALRLVEDDYLGGLGSRGSGRVRFEGIRLTARAREHYGQGAVALPAREHPSVDDLLARWGEVQGWVRDALRLAQGAG